MRRLRRNSTCGIRLRERFLHRNEWEKIGTFYFVRLSRVFDLCEVDLGEVDCTFRNNASLTSFVYGVFYTKFKDIEQIHFQKVDEYIFKLCIL